MGQEIGNTGQTVDSDEMEQPLLDSMSPEPTRERPQREPPRLHEPASPIQKPPVPPPFEPPPPIDQGPTQTAFVADKDEATRREQDDTQSAIERFRQQQRAAETSPPKSPLRQKGSSDDSA